MVMRVEERYVHQRECMHLVKQLHDKVEKHMNNALREYDLTMAQMGALVYLRMHNDGVCTLKEFEQLLHLAQSTTAGIAKRLEKKGLVKSSVDLNDRRNKIIHIMPAGKALCDNATKDADVELAGLFSKLSNDELITLHNLLTKMCDK